jgi:hypothetical protein
MGFRITLKTPRLNDIPPNFLQTNEPSIYKPFNDRICVKHCMKLESSNCW